MTIQEDSSNHNPLPNLLLKKKIISNNTCVQKNADVIPYGI